MGIERTEQSPSRFAEESDGDLLVYMTMSGEDPSAARAAWEEFYRRHAEYLYAVCMRAYGSLLGGQPGVCDLVADTFRRAYEKADRFDAEGISDPERLRLRTRGWLGRIAQRRAQDVLRGRRRMPTAFLELEQWGQMAGPTRSKEASSEELRRVQEALLGLSEREQLVLRATLQWYDPGRAHQRLPNDVAAGLARTLRTTSENLRQIRRRALKKVEDRLRERIDEQAETDR